MTRIEEYRCAISAIYRSGIQFIKSSKMYYGLKFETLCNAYINLIDEVIYCAYTDDFITLDGYNELLKYADKLTRYLKGCLE